MIAALAALGTIVALAGTLAAATPSPPTPEILAQDDYRFCHDERYPLVPEDRVWCPIVGERNDACPALPKACAAPPAPADAWGRSARGPGRRAHREQAPGSGRAGGGAPGSGARGDGAQSTPGESASGNDATGDGTRGDSAQGDNARGDNARGDNARGDNARGDIDREPPPRRVEPPPPAMSLFAKILFFVLIAVGIAAIARAIAQAILRTKGRDDEDGEENEQGAASPGARAESPARRGPIETDVTRLLARARAAAAKGDYERALADTYAALLRRLDGEGLIEIHPFYTNGDYLRALRERRDLREAVRAIFRDVERVQFGAEPPSPTIFQSVYERVAPLATRSLAAVALCVFLAVAGLSCGGDAFDGRVSAASGAPRAAWGSAGPSGTRAISELLARRNIESRRRIEPLRDLGDARITLVLLPGVEVDPEEWPAIFDWVDEHDGVLILAGAVAPEERTGVRATIDEGVPPTIEIDPMQSILDTDLGPLAAPGDWALEIEGPANAESRPTFIDDEGPAPLLRRGESIYATFERRGQGRVLVFADGELFTNIALTTGGNADAITDLLAAFYRPVEICDAWTGAGATTPLDAMREAKLSPIILQLLIFAALLLLWKGLAFGTLRDPQETRRRAFADHARALGLHYARARASRHVLGQYGSWVIERLRERFQRGLRGGIVPLAEAVAARTGRSEAEVVEVLVEAQSERDAAGPPSFRSASRRLRTPEADEARDLALMRALTGFLAVADEPNKTSRPS